MQKNYKTGARKYEYKQKLSRLKDTIRRQIGIIMSIPPGTDIYCEKHKPNIPSQCLYLEKSTVCIIRKTGIFCKGPDTCLTVGKESYVGAL